jgi:tetratricopeptide (TPR) repeat protein
MMRKNPKSYLVFLLGIWFLSSSSLLAESSSIQSLIQRGDELLKKPSEANALAAAKEYEKALKQDPQNYDANWKAAQAYCFALDFKTNGLIEEKDEFKPFLKEYGEKGELYGSRAYAINPKGLDALVWYNGSYAYHAASLGIVKAILKGAANKVKDLARELIELDDTYHGAFGYRILGRFNLKAPFPAGSKKKAIEFLEKAVAKDPTDLQNHFWLAEAYFAQKKTSQAREQYQYVIDHPPAEIEIHLDSVLKSYSQKRLSKIPN